MTAMTVRYSTAPDLSGATITDPVTTDSASDFTGHIDLSGLTPGTKYYYTLQQDGVDQSSAPYPSFTTFRAAGTPGITKFFFGSCTGQSGSDTIFTAVPADALFGFHLGDVAYQGSNSTLAQFRALLRSHFDGQSGYCQHFAELRARVPVFVMWDDNDSGAAGNTTPIAIPFQAFQEYGAQANPDSPTAGAIYYSFQIGDVGFFVPDERSYASSKTATDDSSKTLLGATQFGILKNWLLTNNAALKLKFILSETPVSGYGTTGADSWGGDWTDDQLPHAADGYRYERNALWDFIDENKITGVVFWSADQHWAGAFKAMYGKTVARPRYEGLATPYNQTVNGGTTYPRDAVNGPVFWKYTAGVNMGVVTVDTTVSPATVSFQLYGPSGSLGSTYSLNLTQDDIDLDLDTAFDEVLQVSSNLPAATVGQAYNGSISAWNIYGTTGTIALAGPPTINLPDGLSLGTPIGSGTESDPKVWPVGGTPAADAMTSTVHIEVSDSAGHSTSEDVTLAVNAAAASVVDDFAQAGTIDNYTVTKQTDNAAAGDAATWSVTDGNLVLDPDTVGSQGVSIAARRNGPWTSVEVNAKLTPLPGWTPKYFVLSLGSGAVTADGAADGWWYTALATGYFMRWNNTGNAFSLRKVVGGVYSTIGTYGTNFSDHGSGYHTYELAIDSANGRVKVLLDGVVVINVADTTFTSGDALVAQGAINEGGVTGGAVASISTVTLTP